MQASDLIVEVRNSSLERVGQILAEDLVGLELALRFNAIGAWKLTLRADHPLVDVLRAPGSGVIIYGPDGVLLSGPTHTATNTKTADDPTGNWVVIGTDDSVILGERLAYPTPSTDLLSGQVDAYDTRSGVAETVVKAYVEANIGASAPVDRRAVMVDTDLGRGVSVTGNARFDVLGSLVSSLLVTSGLGFDVVQSGSDLIFEVFEPVDRSATVRMDVDNLRLTKSEYSYTAPTATRVIVGGQGQGVERLLVERTSTDSSTAETVWNRRIEVFKDSRNASATADLEQAGDEILADQGKTVEAISVSPSDDQTMRYGVDWGLGDLVTVVVGSQEISQIVSEVAIVVAEDGVKVGATVGDPVVASADNAAAQVVNATTSQEARISNLERNDAGGSSGGSSWGNVDGGLPGTNYGGGTSVDGGSV